MQHDQKKRLDGMHIWREGRGARDCSLEEGSSEVVDLVERASSQTLLLVLVGCFAWCGDGEGSKATLASPPVGAAHDRLIEETPPLGEHCFAQLPSFGFQNVVTVDTEGGTDSSEDKTESRRSIANSSSQTALVSVCLRRRERTEGHGRQASRRRGVGTAAVSGREHVGSHSIPVDGSVKDKTFVGLVGDCQTAAELET